METGNHLNVRNHINDTQALLENRSSRFRRTYFHALDLLRAAIGINDGSIHIDEWAAIRTAIINESAFDDLWKDKDFKQAMHFINDLVDVSIIISYNFDLREGHGKMEESQNERLESDLAEWCISECCLGDDSELKAIQHLLNIMNVLDKNSAYHGLDPDDLYDLKMKFTTIAQCQQMVLTAFQDEDKEKRRQLKKAA